MKAFSKEAKETIRKSLIVAVEIILMVIVVYTIICLLNSIGFAEEGTITAYVICQPGDYVNIRSSAKFGNNLIGRLDSGDPIEIDGTVRNGFMRLVNMPLESASDAWVYAGYIVYDEPVNVHEREAIVVSNHNLAARKNCTGRIRRWLKTGTELIVYWFSETWCVTNKGFVMSQYIELDGE